MSAPPSAVLWDADGVLQRVPGGVEESMRPAVAGLVDDVDGFLVEALREERPALAGRVRWLDVLPGLLERWGIADAYDDVVRVWLNIEPVPASLGVVEELRRRGVRSFLASNQDERRASYMSEELCYAKLFDDELYSCALGAAKPDPEYFLRALDRIGLEPGQVLFVDDRPDNVEAARSLGLRAETWSCREDVALLREHLARHGLPA